MAKRSASAQGSRRSGTGRVTPKGTRPSNTRRGPGPTQPESGGRYTPPSIPDDEPSPRWVAVLMFGLLALGVLTIIVNYLGLLPGDADNRFLLLGLLLVTGGIVVATRYR